MFKRLSWVLSFLAIALTTIAVINNRENDPDFMEPYFKEISSLFDQRHKTNKAVSQADVAWHLYHILKTINNSTSALAKADPAAYKPRFNFSRSLVHSSGFIPRGRAEAPAALRPSGPVSLDSLTLQLQMAKANVKLMAALPQNHFYEHAVFDQLDRDQTRRFLLIHTRHHLKIIKDILQE